MEYLTIENIGYIEDRAGVASDTHLTTIIYLQSLLKPYAEILDQATTVNGIIEWIPLVFPEQYREDIIKEIRSDIDADLDNVDDMFYESPEAVKIARNAVINWLLIEIISSIYNSGLEYHEHNIFPWDVQNFLEKEFPGMFGITKDDNKLPVEINIGQNKFNHMLTYEFTMGLVMFSNPKISNSNYTINMFGIPLICDFIVHGEPINMYEMFNPTNRIHNKFSVNIMGEIYEFLTPDFMHGFITGASWSGVDHHNYWKDLKQHKTDENGNIIVANITF